MKRSTTGPAGDDLQFKLLLPRALHQRIAASAEESGNSVSEEIRRRLEASFALPDADRDTLLLVEAIKLAAPSDWHTASLGFARLVAAIEVILGQFRPRHALWGPMRRDAASVAQDGAALAGAALNKLGIPFKVGQTPVRMPEPRNEEGSEP